MKPAARKPKLRIRTCAECGGDVWWDDSPRPRCNEHQRSAQKPVTLAQLRAEAPKGTAVYDYTSCGAGATWNVHLRSPTIRIETEHADRQTARRMCLAALREMRNAR